MASSIDSYLGIHTRALALESRRTELLAANIANADTPNYKARDLDFKASLASAASDAAPLYRVPTAPSLDGNTVDEQLEQAAFAENSVRYQATLTLLSGKLRALMTAITGQ
jgi:flagellar basal-body rod protein FlgB